MWREGIQVHPCPDIPRLARLINACVSWEYRPLSFIYLVFGQGGFTASENRNEQRVIARVTWLKQW